MPDDLLKRSSGLLGRIRANADNARSTLKIPNDPAPAEPVEQSEDMLGNEDLNLDTLGSVKSPEEVESTQDSDDNMSKELESLFNEPEDAEGLEEPKESEEPDEPDEFDKLLGGSGEIEPIGPTEVEPDKPEKREWKPIEPTEGNEKNLSFRSNKEDVTLDMTRTDLPNLWLARLHKNNKSLDYGQIKIPPDVKDPVNYIIGIADTMLDHRTMRYEKEWQQYYNTKREQEEGKTEELAGLETSNETPEEIPGLELGETELSKPAETETSQKLNENWDRPFLEVIRENTEPEFYISKEDYDNAVEELYDLYPDRAQTIVNSNVAEAVSKYLNQGGRMVLVYLGKRYLIIGVNEESLLVKSIVGENEESIDISSIFSEMSVIVGKHENKTITHQNSRSSTIISGPTITVQEEVARLLTENNDFELDKNWFNDMVSRGSSNKDKKQVIQGAYNLACELIDGYISRGNGFVYLRHGGKYYKIIRTRDNKLLVEIQPDKKGIISIDGVLASQNCKILFREKPNISTTNAEMDKIEAALRTVQAYHAESEAMDEDIRKKLENVLNEEFIASSEDGTVISRQAREISLAAKLDPTNIERHVDAIRANQIAIQKLTKLLPYREAYYRELIRAHEGFIANHKNCIHRIQKGDVPNAVFKDAILSNI